MPKVLLVEDNEMNRDMLSRRLERKGYDVVMATDGESGVTMAHLEAPDLILMDMSLPVLDGWEATRRLKADAATQHIPVIALTAHAMSSDRDKALEAGCDDYDTKPVELPRLLSKIEALLEERMKARRMKDLNGVTESTLAASENEADGAAVDGQAADDQAAQHAVPSQLLHDLRTPLNQIIGYSEMLAEQAQEEGQDGFVPDLRRVHLAGQQLLSLINSRFLPVRTPTLGRADPVPAAPIASSSTSTASAAPSEDGAPEPLSSGEGQGLLLVVDDNETNRDVLSRRLQRQGYATATAEDGRQALEMVRSRGFDLVLLDIMMPEMDGYEVLRQLKADESLRHLPVIMISALNEMDSVVRCIEMGAEDYLLKPFNPTLLKARVGACLDKKRSHDRERRLFAQLQENYGRLQELEKMRDDLTHMIVHDLRTPLSSLLAGLQTMPLLAPLAPEHKECYNIALRGGGTLLSMINDLLDISKMESGTFDLQAAPLLIPDLLEESIEQIASSTRDKNLSLVRQAEPNLPPLLADEDKLRRILVNLLGNAQKFTPKNGTITLAARRIQDENASESILFSVSDTGEGIPPQAFARIFEKFGQVEGRQAGRQMSTGLGLTFCKMAVEAHGGRIWVASTLGEGSTFFFTIPLRLGAAIPNQE